MAALLIAVALVASPASAQHEHHAAAQPAAASSRLLYNAEDLQFLRHMIVHHQQALAMAALVPERTDRPELERFARYVSDAQAAEIRMMEGLLRLAAERGLEASAHEHAPDADPPMAGMLSAAEMAALEAASGAEFERLWLQGMIFHHEGGLAMARVQQLQQLHNGRRPHGLEVLVEEILIVQRAEIAEMQGWLAAWGLGPSTDERPPAAEVSSPAPGATLAAGQPAQLLGMAVDDLGLADVRVGVQDLGSGAWLQADGGWGPRALHAATLTKSGPASAAWAFSFTPPTPGEYAVAIEVEDAAGKRGAGPEARVVAAE